MYTPNVALITGASRGLGLEVARALARRRAHLILTARRAPALALAAEELSRHTAVIALAGDVAERSHAARLVGQGVQRFGAIDLLVNNASTLGPTPLPPVETLSLDALEEVFRVNVAAPLQLVQLVLPQMKGRGRGTIVNITSDAAVRAYARWGGYGASKSALEHLSRVLAVEAAGSGVRVYVVDPGDMNTQMHRDADPDADPAHLPGPDLAAARLVELLDRETAAFGRFELANEDPREQPARAERG